MDLPESIRQKIKVILFVAISIFILWLGSFLWRNFINMGKLSIDLEPPYTVLLPDGEIISCTEEPCEISLPAGLNPLFIQKEDYNNLAENVSIKRFFTTDYSPILTLRPTLEVIDNFPTQPSTKIFDLQIDTNLGRQVLIEDPDNLNLRRAVLNEPIENYNLYSTNDTVVIHNLDSPSQILKIDLINETKDLIVSPNFINLRDLELANNGNYLSFIDSANQLFVVIDSEIIPLNLDSKANLFKWSYNNQLYFFSSVNYEFSPREGDFKNYIELSPNINSLFESEIEEETDQKIMNILAFHPKENSFSEIYDLSIFDLEPEELRLNNNLSKIFFSSGEDIFQLQLKK